MIKGLTEDQEKIIKNILNKYPYEFYYYGSRVKGDYTKSSDLDIMLKSDNTVPSGTIKKIEDEFNASKIPFIVNIADYANLEEYFYKLIEKDLVKV